MARSTGSSSERPESTGAGGLTRAYLDYASFSPVDPRVVAVMRPFLEGGAGNPSAAHSLGLEAGQAARPIDQAGRILQPSFGSTRSSLKLRGVRISAGVRRSHAWWEERRRG